jgi:5-methylcytosine-specific restriction endonuclease McrA
MGRNATAGGWTVNGAHIRMFFLAVVREYGTTCHLCGGPGADTVDHLIPTSVNPTLRWEMSNARPAHYSCNSKRRAAPLSGEWQTEGW